MDRKIFYSDPEIFYEKGEMPPGKCALHLKFTRNKF